jgi:Asp-tRNA(Asn)/Glu-tRNA(Gln) amidotransferase A subunit family amidase
MHELLGLSLIDLRERLRSRAASPVELCEAVFERIDATADTLNSVVAERDRDAVRAEAREAEARIARGEARELEGIPLGVKDLENVAGLRTTHGSWLFRDNVAARDDVHVARLRAAGAIPMAKTNAPEFGPTAITKNLLHGVTRSPWNLEHTPGGSSGGSAAALSRAEAVARARADRPQRALGLGTNGGLRSAHAHGGGCRARARRDLRAFTA